MEIHHGKTVKLDEIYFDNDLNDARGDIAPIDVVSLAKDIGIRGLTQPIVVCPLTEDLVKETGKQYRLICGYRRATAHKVLQWDNIDAIVREPMTELDARLLNFSENVERKDLNILQQAKGLLRLMQLGLTEEKIAAELNQSRGWVQIRTMLLKLPKDIQLEAASGILSHTHIREVYTICNKQGEEAAYKAVRKIKEAKEKTGRNITVNPNSKNLDKKSIRKRSEMFEMMDNVRHSVGNCIITRTLAWASGEITTREFFESCDEYATSMGKTFIQPREDEE